MNGRRTWRAKLACIHMLFFLTFGLPAWANPDVFIAHCRERAPELVPVNDQCIGPIPDMVNLAVSKLGYEVRWQHIPWKRSLELARLGQVDLLPRHSMTEERQRFLYPIVYGKQTRRVMYYLAPHWPRDVTDFEQLSLLRVGALEGSFYSYEFNDALNVDKTFVRRTQQLLEMLRIGRIDAAVTSNSHELELFEARVELRRASYVEHFENRRYISIPKQSPKAELHLRLAAVIAEMRHSGEIANIYQRYELPAPDTVTD